MAERADRPGTRPTDCTVRRQEALLRQERDTFHTALQDREEMLQRLQSESAGLRSLSDQQTADLEALNASLAAVAADRDAVRARVAAQATALSDAEAQRAAATQERDALERTRAAQAADLAARDAEAARLRGERDRLQTEVGAQRAHLQKTTEELQSGRAQLLGRLMDASQSAAVAEGKWDQMQRDYELLQRQVEARDESLSRKEEAVKSLTQEVLELTKNVAVVEVCRCVVWDGVGVFPLTVPTPSLSTIAGPWEEGGPSQTPLPPPLSDLPPLLMHPPPPLLRTTTSAPSRGDTTAAPLSLCSARSVGWRGSCSAWRRAPSSRTRRCSSCRPSGPA